MMLGVVRVTQPIGIILLHSLLLQSSHVTGTKQCSQSSNQFSLGLPMKHRYEFYYPGSFAVTAFLYILIYNVRRIEDFYSQKGG